MGTRAHKNKKKSFFLCARVRVPYLEYFSKVNFEKNLTLQIFLIFKCAHAHAHENQKKKSFFLCARAPVPYLEYFSKKNQLSYLEYFSKVNFEKNLTLNFFFDIQMRTRGRAQKKKSF